MKRLHLVLIMIVPLLLLAGCATTSPAALDSSSTAPAATSDTQQSVCQALAKIDDALTSLSKAGNNITVGEVKKIQAGIGAALNVVSRLAPSDANSTIDQLKSANDQIGKAVADLPDDDTLGQHGQQLQQFKEQVAKAQTATARLAARLNCSA